MPLTAHQPLHKMRATMAAAVAYCTAIVPLRGGGISRVSRCICVISVATAGSSAAQKCQFGASLPHSRRTIRREYCTNCNKCSNNCHIGTILSIE